ncbi:uncharacterized protein LOC125945232 [Dermacentor silvarum]|uniref:uncharacterized protein LOC125945232 n=1 Tax=Dermacentor silvarum TaxID=543639 RepID=UPI0021018C55|nr:uncharacterized protein LOC125945232 [Dermacentor silvarum]
MERTGGGDMPGPLSAGKKKASGRGRGKRVRPGPAAGAPSSQLPVPGAVAPQKSAPEERTAANDLPQNGQGDEQPASREVKEEAGEKSNTSKPFRRTGSKNVKTDTQTTKRPAAAVDGPHQSVRRDEHAPTANAAGCGDNTDVSECTAPHQRHQQSSASATGRSKRSSSNRAGPPWQQQHGQPQGRGGKGAVQQQRPGGASDDKTQHSREQPACPDRSLSVVEQALLEPDVLTPEQMERLAHVLCKKALNDADSAEPAAKFCATVIMKESEDTFLDFLMDNCRDRFRQREQFLPRCGAIGAATEQALTAAGPNHRWRALVSFLAELLGAISERGSVVGTKLSGRAFCLAAMLCECCKVMLDMMTQDDAAELECLHFALKTAGRGAERAAPLRVSELAKCLRDRFLAEQCPPEARMALLELLELRASGWKMEEPQERYYTEDAGGAQRTD